MDKDSVSLLLYYLLIVIVSSYVSRDGINIIYNPVQPICLGFMGLIAIWSCGAALLARSMLTKWLWVYELVSIAVSAAIGVMLYFSGRTSPVESIAFIRSHGVLDAVLHIWLSNVSSFLLAAVLVVLHPVAGVFAVAYTSVFLGELLASWLAGYCGTAHIAYGLVET